MVSLNPQNLLCFNPLVASYEIIYAISTFTESEQYSYYKDRVHDIPATKFLLKYMRMV